MGGWVIGLSLLSLLALICCLLSAACLDLLMRHAERLGLRKTNFRGEAVVSSLGAALWMVMVPVYALAAVLALESRSLLLAFAAVGFAAGLLGLLDDRFGSRAVGGVRGHFGELRKGHLTTGAAKAVLLPAAALAAAWFVMGQHGWGALVTTALVALSANTINLLDVRPVRAVTGWLVGLFVALLLVGLNLAAAWPLLLLGGPVLVYLPLDASRKGMLGDVGANLLGALMGLQWATAAPTWAQVGIMVLLLCLHFYSEDHSLSGIIEKHWWLRWLDSLGRLWED